MKTKNVIIGEIYLARVSGKLVKVRIIKKSAFAGWDAVNLETKRWVRIKTAARLRYASLPKEMSFLSRMAGLAQAAHQVAAEEKIFNGPMQTEVVQ